MNDEKKAGSGDAGRRVSDLEAAITEQLKAHSNVRRYLSREDFTQVIRKDYFDFDDSKLPVKSPYGKDGGGEDQFKDELIPSISQLRLIGRTNRIVVFSVLDDFLDGVFGREPSEAPTPTQHPQPPINAEFVLHLLLRGDEQDAIIGDLIERYGKKHARLGVRRANLWFYAEIFRTALPLLKRAVAKASGLVVLGEWIRRHIS